MFKVRCTGNDDGSYTLAFGKGKKKLTATLYKMGNGWGIEGAAIRAKMKRDVVAMWGAGAESTYRNGISKVPELATDSPASTPSLSAPPKRQKPQAAGAAGAAGATGYELRPHTGNILYPYPDGYALWRQVGFFKSEDAARKAMNEQTDFSGEGEPNAQIN